MKLKLALALLFVAFCFVPARANPPEVLAQWNGERIDWLGFDEGVASARETGRPIFVVFYTTWCPHCARYSGRFFDTRVPQLAEELVMVMVDRDDNPGINDRYGQYGGYIPRTMVLTPEAELIPALIGSNIRYPHFLDTYEPEELVDFMTRAAAWRAAGG